MKFLSLCFLFVSSYAYAGFYIVVNANNMMSAISIEDVADVYLGRKKVLGSIYIDQVLDRTSEQRRRFFFAVTNMQESQVNAYWAKLKFSGRMRAPEVVGSEDELINIIANNPQAVGYTTTSPPEGVGVRVALYIDE